MLHQGHPRLLARSNDWAALRARIKTDQRLQQWVEAIRDDGKKLLRASPSKYEIPDGKRLLATSRRVLSRVQTLGCLWQLDHDRRWAGRAWQELDAAAHFKDWNPSHFLDTAEMTHAFAIGYDWLFDAWTDSQRDTLRRAIVELGIQPAMKVYEEKEWWARTRNNWNQVCNGGIGMGALALADIEPDLSRRALHAGLNSIQIAMNEFAPDGASVEGPGYWRYATYYNIVFLAALESALGNDFGLSEFPGVSQTGWFPIYMTGPTGRPFNYADSSEGPVRAPQLFWLAAHFHQPAFAAFELKQHSPTPLDLLWYHPVNESGIPPVPLSRYFRGPKVVTLRGSWSDPETTFVGFKAGKNNDSHGHLDIGDFVIEALGERWAVDFGSDDYNLPGYFGGKRWNYYRLRAEGHNTLVINPADGPDQLLTSTPITRFGSKTDRAFAIGDLTAAYAPAARRIQRGVCLMRGRDVIVQDEVAADSPVDLWWFMQTRAEAVLENDEVRVLLSQNGKQVELTILEPTSTKFRVMPAESLPSSPHPERQASNKGYRKLAIHLPQVTHLRLVVLCSPDVGKKKPVEIRGLDQW